MFFICIHFLVNKILFFFWWLSEFYFDMDMFVNDNFFFLDVGGYLIWFNCMVIVNIVIVNMVV